MTPTIETLIRILARMPTVWLYPFARMFAFCLRHFIRYRYKVIAQNLQAAFPEMDAATIERLTALVYDNLADLCLEIIRATRIGCAELQRRVEVRGLELINQEIEAGRSVVLLSAHQCNWEWLLLRCSAALRAPVWALYKPLHDERANQIMARTRSRFGARPVIAREVFSELVQCGQQARVVAMVADQIPPREDEKYWATFFGQDTAFYVGPAKLARITRASVMFAGMRRIGRGRYVVEIEPLTRPPYTAATSKVMDAYIERVEKLIRADPGAWLWSHRRWKYKKPLYG